MTEEEYKLAEEVIKPIYYNAIQNGFSFAKYGVECFLAGLKAVRPVWHKVADGDLPKRVDDYVTNIGVLTYDNYGNGVHKWHTPHCRACDYADEVGDDEVIAWCEIPKCMEEKKMNEAGKDMNAATRWHKVADGDLPEEYTEVLNDDGVKVELRNKHWRYVYGEAWEDDACVEHWCEIPKCMEE